MRSIQWIILFGLISIFIIGHSTIRKTYSDSTNSKEYFFYYYDTDDQRNVSAGNPLNLSAYPLNLGNDLTLDEILDSISKLLTKHFRRNNYIPNINSVSFEYQQSEILKTNNKNYTIAIINIIDPQKVCMSYFFQGSAGAQETYNILGCNLLQPTFDQSLVDGVIILYNGSPLESLDHINLRGILVPRFFEDEVFNAKIRTLNPWKN